jgi:mannitol 2-dehydrogenase
MPIIDPMAGKLRERAHPGGKDWRHLLAMRELFSEQLANAAPFVDEVSAALRSFYENGAKATLANYAEV